MDLKKIKEAIDSLKEDLGTGLVACDIWKSGTGQAIVSFNPQPKATALFDNFTSQLQKMLKDAEFPGLSEFYMLDVEGDAQVLVLQFKELQLGMLINKLNTNMGILFSIAIPNVRKAIQAAE